MFRPIRYEYGDDSSTTDPNVAVMIPRLMTVLLFMMLWCSDSAASPPVTMKVGLCTGKDGPVGSDSVFGCDLKVEPPGVAITVYAFSSCALSPGPQTIEGKVRLLFRTAPKVSPGPCSITLILVNETTNVPETSVEATVQVIGASLRSLNEGVDEPVRK